MATRLAREVSRTGRLGTMAGPEGRTQSLAQVPQVALKCVAFLSPALATRQQRSVKQPQGTVFFVYISDRDPEPRGDYHWLYAVTARHVIAAMAADGHSEVDIRLNRLGGDTVAMRMPLADWRLHPESEVAVAPMVMPEGADHLAWPVRMCVTDDILRVNSAGPGDEVCMSGLFAHRPGTASNIPIVRTGAVAAMPGEPIKTDHGTFPAYLIETRSTPGMSGSPVFLNLSGFRSVPRSPAQPEGNEAPVLERALVSGFYLLGVGYGHYQGPYRSRPTSTLQRINTGISLAVPSKRITDLLLHEEEKRLRRETLARAQAGQTGAAGRQQ
jgi:hypothetical protein